MNEGQQLIRTAVYSDKAGNYDQAKEYYKRAVAQFKLALSQKDISTSQKENAQKTCDMCEIRIKAIELGKPFPEYTSSSGGEAQVHKPSKVNENKNIREEAEIAEYKDKIFNTIIGEKKDAKWSDVVGLDEAKQVLNETVVLQIKLKHAFSRSSSPCYSVLLYGPEGAGKSFLAKALASAASTSTFFNVSSSDLVSERAGESERIIRALFCIARRNAPAIIFIDGIESLLSEQSEYDSSSRRIKAEFLNQMNGVDRSMEGVILIAATNSPWALHQEVRCRFEKKIYIPIPKREVRRAMIDAKLKKIYNNLTEDQIDQVAKITEGYTSADFDILIREASTHAIGKLQYAEYFREYEGQLYPCMANDAGAKKMNIMDRNFPADKVAAPPVTFADIKESTRRIHPLVSSRDISRYEEWTNAFIQ